MEFLSIVLVCWTAAAGATARVRSTRCPRDAVGGPRGSPLGSSNGQRRRVPTVEPTSPTLVVACGVLALCLPVLIVLTWRRRPHGIPGMAVRLLAILLSQALAIG